MYEFKEDLYPSNITYHYARSVFNFFQTQEHTKNFFLYLHHRLSEDYKSRKKGGDFCVNVLRNDNNNYPLIDINYNFFVLVLAEWIEHYSVDSETVYEYSKYKKVTYVNKHYETGEDVNVTYNQRRDLKITCSIKERVLFDYSFSGWMVSSNLHRNFRFDFVQILMNNILGKHTFVPSYNYRYRAVTVKPTLVFDELKNENILFAATSFFRSTLKEYYTSRQMRSLIDMGEDLKRLGTKKLEKNDDNKFIFNGKVVKFCDHFDIEIIEEKRDENDGKYHSFEEVKSVVKKKKSDEKEEDFEE